MKRIIYSALFAVSVFVGTSCSDYLDIVPDNIPSIQQVFDTRENAFKMLYTCYDYLPRTANVFQNPALLCGDENWNPEFVDPNFYYYRNKSTVLIAKGQLNATDPLLNYWDGGDYSNLDQKFGDGNESTKIKSLWAGIRNCNTFIDNVDEVPDMTKEERAQWKAEAQVLKAYYHYYLLQMYGPIPFMDKNLDISLPPEEVQREREPVDDVVAKIVKVLDEAINSNSLTSTYAARKNELGRINLPIALAIKAKVLVLAASPIFNGNKKFRNFKNSAGVPFMNPELSVKKWQDAADACKAAIKAAHDASLDFYTFNQKFNGLSVNDTTQLELNLRGQFTENNNNTELVWGVGRQDVQRLIYYASCPLYALQISARPLGFNNLHGATMNVVDQFYSDHGVPIEEDKTYDYSKRFSLIPVPAKDHFYFNSDTAIKVPYYNTGREPRFYAYLGFDQGKYFSKEIPNDDNSYVIHSKANDFAGAKNTMFSITGYTCKKLIPWNREWILNSTDNIGETIYFFPIIRLSDLYLMCAEALNESKTQPDDEVYQYIQPIRTKAGLDKETGDLVQTWAKYSSNPTKPTTKEGMRDIIRQERMVELAFEGQRYWDLKRWMLAEEYLNKPIRGWNAYGTTESDYYLETYIYQRKFATKDYFWPIRQKSLDSNHKLVQNMGW
ncbi:MAG: RagB/SusD family nutrient uptake outer membrane protein [Bacteroidota bacterium]|nr:RagB/SusD family nutrient uptake outer membrane protein [Bacteroidota bacterium]